MCQCLNRTELLPLPKERCFRFYLCNDCSRDIREEYTDDILAMFPITNDISSQLLATTSNQEEKIVLLPVELPIQFPGDVKY